MDAVTARMLGSSNVTADATVFQTLEPGVPILLPR
jgi:hypothetical protein